MLDISHLGDRIRECRKKKMITIKTLSQYTGLSSGYLSMLEQNKTSPNVDSLAKICDALDVSIGYILEGTNPGKTVVRAEERKTCQYPDENMTVDIIDFEQGGGFCQYITIWPGQTIKREVYRHVGSEICMVLSGVMSINLSGTVYKLKAGDSVYVKGGECHCIYNEGPEKTESLWACQKRTVGVDMTK